MAFYWTEDLATGIEIIDQQHQEIFDKGNKFVAACKEGKGRDALLDTLNFLGNYVDDHFSQEEKFMAKHNYPDFKQHIEQHKYLREVVASLRAQLSENGPTLSIITDTNQKLLSWFVDHIKKSDRVLGSFLKQQWGLL